LLVEEEEEHIQNNTYYIVDLIEFSLFRVSRMASIQRRGSVWRAVIRRTGHPTQVKSFPLKSAAEAWARKLEREMDAAEFVDRRSCKDTARSIMERYRQQVSPTKKGARWETVRLTKLLRAPWTAKSVNEVSRKDIADWKAAQTISGASLRREMVLLSSVFNHAINEWGMPIVNPMRGVSLPADSKARDRRPSATELGAIRSHFVKKKMGLLVDLAIETAMRLGELCQIRWSAIDVDRRCVRLADTKNGHPRLVPLSSRAVELLAEDRLVSPGEQLFPFSAESAGVYWREAMKTLGIRNLHFHDLRHEAITRMVPKFPNVVDLASVTGHRSLKQLQRYYNPDPLDLARRLDG
jgi:integrase